MMSPFEPDPTASSQSTPARSRRVAELALLLGTFAWGCGFTWAKCGGDAFNAAAERPASAAFGPMALLSLRFTAAGVLWLIVFPAARRGWSTATVGRSVLLGILLSAGLLLQHLGLGRTSESVSAFLTSLTILFVPLMMTLGLRRPPPARMWIGVFCATLGVGLMTGAAPAGFDLGALLGVACAIVYAVDIIVINIVLPNDSTWRVTAGQFLTIGIVCAAVSCVADPAACRTFSHNWHKPFADSGILIDTILLIIGPTLLAFGLMNHFQPRLDPTRATIIYLLEPVFAALYSALIAWHLLNGIGYLGAGLILGANLLVEWLESRAKAELAVASSEAKRLWPGTP